LELYGFSMIFVPGRSFLNNSLPVQSGIFDGHHASLG
jgi:hypothetical protein